MGCPKKPRRKRRQSHSHGKDAKARRRIKRSKPRKGKHRTARDDAHAHKSPHASGGLSIDHRRKVRKVLVHLKENPGISRDDLGRSVGISGHFLGILHRRHTGVTLRWRMRVTRMKHAARLLATTELNVNEVASECGYSHASSFDRAFIAFHRMTPHEYRRRHS